MVVTFRVPDKLLQAVEFAYAVRMRRKGDAIREVANTESPIDITESIEKIVKEDKVLADPVMTMTAIAIAQQVGDIDLLTNDK